MSIKSMTLMLAAGGLSLWALHAAAQTNSTAPLKQPAPVSVSSASLVSRYSLLAGSTGNAQALVTGLQSGSSVTLTAMVLSDPTAPPVPPATFTPATPHLGLGEVNISLALARAELSKLGISNPTPAQLQAALNGGTLTAADGSSVKLSGVLAQRQAGLGWGQIARSMGLKLGSVVSASQSEHAGKKAGRGDADGSVHGAAASHANANAGGGNGGNGGNGGGGGSKK